MLYIMRQEERIYWSLFEWSL